MELAPRPKSRDAIKAWNRKKIIDATIDVLARHGITGTTVARVVEVADVSTGLINAHFKTMNALLDEVLTQMADEYKLHWRESLEKASKHPDAQLKALLLADFDPQVLNLKTMGVWFAFRAMARSRPKYIELVGTREKEQMQKMKALLHQLNEDSGSVHDPQLVASGLTAMLDGIWTDYYLYPDSFDRDINKACVFMFLDGLYPGMFALPDYIDAGN